MKSLLLLVCALPSLVTPLNAALIFDNSDTPQFTTLRTNEGVAAYLGIGSSDVAIDRIAINAAPTVSGQLKFVIFSDVAYPGYDAGSLLFSETVDVARSSGLVYELSDPISFRLQAGHYYDIGAIFNGGDITFAYDLVSDTMGGISSITRNENVGQFASPFLEGHALGDAEIQLYSSAGIAPEPLPSALTGFALAAFALCGKLGRRRCI